MATHQALAGVTDSAGRLNMAHYQPLASDLEILLS